MSVDAHMPGFPVKKMGLIFLVVVAVVSACEAPDDSSSRDAAADGPTIETGPADAAADTAAASTADGSEVDTPPGVANPARLFEVIDDLDHDAGHEQGFICPIGLCSWLSGPALDGSAGGAAGADLVPPVPARGQSLKAWHLTAAAGSAGLDVKLDVHAPGFPRVLYPDLRNYAAVAFWARAERAGDELLVAVEDDRVIAPRYGLAAATSRPWFTRPVTLSAQWRRYIIAFEDFRQVGPDGGVLSTGGPNTAAIWSFHFIGGLGGRSADLWVDDLTLLCRGPCLVPPHDLHERTTASGLKDEDLAWARAATSAPDVGCGELTELAMTPLDGWLAGPGRKVYLRVRVAANPSAAVPLWAWTVEKLPAGPLLSVTALDEGWTTVSVPVPEPGEYRVRAHTHYPATATCGLELTAKTSGP
jgi:hypothetical protein